MYMTDSEDKKPKRSSAAGPKKSTSKKKTVNKPAADSHENDSNFDEAYKKKIQKKSD